MAFPEGSSQFGGPPTSRGPFSSPDGSRPLATPDPLKTPANGPLGSPTTERATRMTRATIPAEASKRRKDTPPLDFQLPTPANAADTPNDLPKQSHQDAVDPKSTAQPAETPTQPQPRYIGFSPSEELHTAGQWKESLTSDNPTGRMFEGNVDHAATLLAGFSEGKTYVHNVYREHGAQLSVPRTIIMTDPTETPNSPISSSHDADTSGNPMLRIAIDWLEQTAQHDPHTSITLIRADGEAAFRGTPFDFFRLTGVEEAHHDIFQQVKPTGKSGPDPLDLSLAAYDATEVEWQALRWQIRFAREKGMPQETQELLQQRFDAAKAVRTTQRWETKLLLDQSEPPLLPVDLPPSADISLNAPDPANPANSIGETLVDRTAPPLEATIEERQALHKAITKLSPLQRKVIEQAFFDGKTNKEIAKKEHVLPHSVDLLRSHALRALRRELTG